MGDLLENITRRDFLRRSGSMISASIPFSSLIASEKDNEGSASDDPFKMPEGYGSWTEKANMGIGRFGSGVVVDKDWLWVFGGFQNKIYSYERGDIVEAYDIKNDRWRSYGYWRSVPRDFFGVTAIHGKIYFVGGIEKNFVENHWKENVVGKVDVLDPDRFKWEESAEMPTPRANLAVVSLEGSCMLSEGLNEPNI